MVGSAQWLDTGKRRPTVRLASWVADGFGVSAARRRHCRRQACGLELLGSKRENASRHAPRSTRWSTCARRLGARTTCLSDLRRSLRVQLGSAATPGRLLPRVPQGLEAPLSGRYDMRRLKAVMPDSIAVRCPLGSLDGGITRSRAQGRARECHVGRRLPPHPALTIQTDRLRLLCTGWPACPAVHPGGYAPLTIYRNGPGG